MDETASGSVSQQSAEKSNAAKMVREPERIGGFLKFWIFIAVVLSLIALGATGYMAYRLEFQIVPQFFSAGDQVEAVSGQIARLTEESGRQSDQFGDQFQKLRSEIDATGTALADLEGAIHESDAQFRQQVAVVKDSLSALYQSERDKENDWQIKEILFLMVMAKHRLDIAGDRDSALLVWQVAREYLGRNADPRLLDAKLAMEAETAALEAIITVDLGDIANRLLMLSAEVASLPLNLSATMLPAPATNADETEPVTERNGSDSSTILSEVWNDISSLVRVKRVDVSERSLLQPDMKIYLVQNLQLALMMAQSAAIRADRQLYQGNLRYVAEAVGLHFSPDSPMVMDFADRLDALIATDIEVSMPDLSDSIGHLRQAIRVGVGE